jgi:hypothetical protein
MAPTAMYGRYFCHAGFTLTEAVAAFSKVPPAMLAEAFMEIPTSPLMPDVSMEAV